MRAKLISILLTSVAACDDAGTEWAVSPDFAGKNARYELSGIACAANWCLAVNDEKRWAQAVILGDRVLSPSTKIRLLPDGFDEVDAEAVAIDSGFVYIAGSHGLSRKTARYRSSQFFVFRFPIDPYNSNLPDLVEPVERSDRLRAAIRAADDIGRFAERPLDENGVNIEGMAADGDRLFFGLRGPSVDGHAFVMEISATALFGDGPLESTIHALPLGMQTGIRDLARINGGFLVLTGPVNNRPRQQGVVFWEHGKGVSAPLLTFEPPKAGKAEGVLVLSESNENVRLLILHDGLKNGGPVEYTIPGLMLR